MLRWISRMLGRGGPRVSTRTDNGAAAFWKAAEQQAWDSGVTTNVRRRYAWVVPAASRLESRDDIVNLPTATREEVRALFDDLKQRYPGRETDELRLLMAEEASRCIDYWNDGTSRNRALMGLNLLADRYLD